MITKKRFFEELDKVEETLIKNIQVACNVVRETAKEMDDESETLTYDVPAVVGQYFNDLCKGPNFVNEVDLSTFLEELK